MRFRAVVSFILNIFIVICFLAPLLELLPEEEGVILGMLVKLEKTRKGTEEFIPGARGFFRPGFDE